MKKINFIIGIHNHQPVGNFDFVFEEAYLKAYNPFLQIVQDFPQIKLSMHFSGILYDWLGANYPEFLDRVARLVSTGQIEIISGGYYEPILPMIPDWDKVGQIDKLNQFVRERFDCQPSGMWIAERVWEPHLPKFMSASGIKFGILDDTHFRHAGLAEDELRGYYTTEEQGAQVNLFPIEKDLRYLIPFESPEDVIEHLRDMADDDGQNIAVFADDGEKFGIWPKTHQHVYTDGWLVDFFTLLGQNMDWINVIHFSQALEQIKPLGRIYLPTSSYSEMLHWALPTRSFQKLERFEHELKEADRLEVNNEFVRGGFWRNFLVKYPEANHLQKRGLRLSQRLQKMRALDSDFMNSDERNAILETAQNHIWASQVNCPYWHGVFGGVYLNNIRYALFKEILLAEKFLDTLEYADDRSWYKLEKYDFDCDGYEDLVVQSSDLGIHMQVEKGGAMVELDFKDVPINLCDTITRREEGYHKKLIDFLERERQPGGEGVVVGDAAEVKTIHDLVVTKQKDLDKYLLYDGYRRASFLDHFLPVTTKLQKFYDGTFVEEGTFIAEPFSYDNQSKKGTVSWSLSREGQVAGQSLELNKKFSFEPGQTCINIDYTLKNGDIENIESLFGIEFNLTLLAGDASDRCYEFDKKIKSRKLASRGEVKEVTSLAMIDEWLQVRLGLSIGKSATVWRFPVETVSASEEGFEKVYQQSCLLVWWKLNLKPGDIWETQLVLDLTRL